MKTGFAIRLIGGLALALASGGCETSEVERLERAIIEKDYMADAEIAALYELSHPYEEVGNEYKPLPPPPGSVAAYERVKEKRERRKKLFGGEYLSDLMDCWNILVDSGLVANDQCNGYSMFVLAFGDMLGCCGKTNDMICCYGILASNGLWQAQQRLYELYLDDANPCYSPTDAALWLGKAAEQMDGYAAEKLAELYESEAISGGDNETIGALYNRAAHAYIRQRKVQAEEELKRKDMPPGGLDCPGFTFICPNIQFEAVYSRRPYARLIKVDDASGEKYEYDDEDNATMRCFEKAISFGNKAAEEHFGKYRKELEYYRETGTFPELGKNVESTGDKAKKGTP